jgi:putative transposase
MPENARLVDCLDEIDLGFVEREATPGLLIKPSIQLHFSILSLSHTVFIIDIFGVDRARSTVHNWVHKVDLQPDSGRSPDHVAVNETVTQLNDQRY